MWEMGHTMSLLLRALILLVESTYPDPLDLSKDQVHIEKGGQCRSLKTLPAERKSTGAEVLVVQRSVSQCD
jgi:hypothetical protein